MAGLAGQISGLTPKLGPLVAVDLLEVAVSRGAGVYSSASVTGGEIAAFLIAQLTVPGVSRWVLGYGTQYFDSDPALASHPWRTQIVQNGVLTLSDGIPNTPPLVPSLNAASHAGGANNLSFTWPDGNYGGTGHLEVWKNGAVLVTNLSPVVTSYVDTGGIVGDSYQVRWNSGVFSTIFSQTLLAS